MFLENVNKFLHDQIVVIFGQETKGWEPLLYTTYGRPDTNTHFRTVLLNHYIGS